PVAPTVHVRFWTCLAVTQNLLSCETRVGTVYRPPVEIVPTTGSPPVMPLTAQVTAVVGVPPSVAWNWMVPFTHAVPVGGVTASTLPTVNGDGDVAVFASTVTGIDP